MRQREDKPKTFASRARLRAWLERNYARTPELNLRLFKVHARDRGVTYREALDEATSRSNRPGTGAPAASGS